jgi:hypothetical protein
MAKTTKPQSARQSESTSKAAEPLVKPSVEQTNPETLEGRIADLDKRIAEINARVPEASATTAPIDSQLVEQQNERISELQRLVADLGQRLAAAQTTTARDEQFNAAVRSVQHAADAVQRGLTPSSSAIARDYAPLPPTEPKHDCGCEPCACISCDCCTFEVWMSHVRVDQMQNPLIDILPTPADSNIVPWGALEIWMFATIDPLRAIGACIPAADPLSNLSLHKQITDPYGPWVTVNRCIGSVMVKKNVPLTVPLELTVVERENDSDRIQPGNRDEWGSTTANLTLDCCYSSYSPLQISVGLTSWGQAGGAVSALFIVKRIC